MPAVVPELGSVGWVTDPLKQLDLIFSHALESDYSQSNIYRGSIVSIPYIVATYQQYPTQLTEMMTAQLKAILLRYFQSANVSISHTNLEDVNKYSLDISIDVISGGKSYNLASIANLEGGKIQEVIKEINK